MNYFEIGFLFSCGVFLLYKFILFLTYIICSIITMSIDLLRDFIEK